MSNSKNIVGLDKLLKNLNKRIVKLKGEDAIAGVLAAALFLEEQSQILTPVVTSNLRNSAFVVAKGVRAIGSPSFKGKDAQKLKTSYSTAASRQTALANSGKFPEARVCYSAFYAAFVHENPRAGKTRGVSPSGRKYKPERGSKRQVFSTVGQWKFLETPLRKNKKRILQIIRSKMLIK